MANPVLVTPRLRLRPLSDADIPDLVRLASRREIADTTATIPHPYTEAHARQFLEFQRSSAGRGESLVLGIQRQSGGQFIGTTGLRGIDHEQAQAEMGFWIGVEFWRQGYATEAAQALLQYAFTTLRLNRVHAHYMVRNPASGRVLEKLGLRREGLLRQKIRKWGVFEDVVLTAILAEDWRAHPDCAPAESPPGS